MNRRRQILWLGAMVMSLAGLVTPFDGRGQEMPCGEELRTLCANVQPGRGRIAQCLKENEAKLSPACAQRMHEVQETARGPLGACRDDWMTYCYHPRASAGQESMLQCLSEHQANVSPDCQKALQGTSGMQRKRSRGMMP